VQGNYEGFRRREVLKAKEVHRAQGMLGSPIELDFTGMESKAKLPSGNLMP